MSTGVTCWACGGKKRSYRHNKDQKVIFEAATYSIISEDCEGGFKEPDHHGESGFTLQMSTAEFNRGELSVIFKLPQEDPLLGSDWVTICVDEQQNAGRLRNMLRIPIKFGRGDLSTYIELTGDWNHPDDSMTSEMNEYLSNCVYIVDNMPDYLQAGFTTTAATERGESHCSEPTSSTLGQSRRLRPVQGQWTPYHDDVDREETGRSYNDHVVPQKEKTYYGMPKLGKITGAAKSAALGDPEAQAKLVKGLTNTIGKKVLPKVAGKVLGKEDAAKLTNEITNAVHGQASDDLGSVVGKALFKTAVSGASKSAGVALGPVAGYAVKKTLNKAGKTAGSAAKTAAEEYKKKQEAKDTITG